MMPAHDPIAYQNIKKNLPAMQCLKRDIEESLSSQSMKSSVIIAFWVLARVFYLFSAIIFTQN